MKKIRIAVLAAVLAVIVTPVVGGFARADITIRDLGGAKCAVIPDARIMEFTVTQC